MRLLGFVVLSALVGCAGVREDSAVSQRADLGPIARVEVVSGRVCEGRSVVVDLPEHCRWPDAAAHTRLLEATFDVVADVDARGAARGVRVVSGPDGYDLEAAAAACAMRGKYRPAHDASGAAVAGETCPVTFKLARYASDLVDARRPPPGEICSPVSPFFPSQYSTTAQGMAGDCRALDNRLP